MIYTVLCQSSPIIVEMLWLPVYENHRFQSRTKKISYFLTELAFYVIK